MALQFRGFPQREQKPRDYSDILTPLAALGQGVQGYLDQGIKQRQLDIQEMANMRSKEQQELEHQKFNYEYGKPISSDEMVETIPPKPIIGKSSFMPGGEAPVSSPSPLIELYNQWVAGGMNPKTARPEFIQALGKDERKQYQEQFDPLRIAQTEWYKNRPTMATTQYTIPTYDIEGNVVGFTNAPQGMKPVGGGRPVNQKGKMSNQAIATTYDLYQTARDGLLSGLENTFTGPFMGKFPAITSNQQTAEGGVAAMAPVLKQLFRVAGEGVFTDRDQALLLQMIPTRDTLPEARSKQIQNIDNIVKAKLGISSNSGMQGSKIRVKNLQTGQTGTISEQYFDPQKYERVP